MKDYNFNKATAAQATFNQPKAPLSKRAKLFFRKYKQDFAFVGVIAIMILGGAQW